MIRVPASSPSVIGELELLHYTTKNASELLPSFISEYEHAKVVKDERLRARAAFLIAAHYEGLDYPKAKEFYNEAHTIAEKLGDEHILSDTLHGLAIDELRKSNFENAAKLERSALILAEKTGHHFRIAFTHYILSIIAVKYGAYEEGIDHLHKSLKETKTHGFLKLQVSIYDVLSELYLSLGEYEKAKVNAVLSLDVVNILDSPPKVKHRAYIRLATIYIEIGEFKLAETIVATFIKETQHTTVDPTLMANALTIRGDILVKQRRYNDAERMYKDALVAIKTLTKYRIESNIHSHIAALFYAMKDSLKGIISARKAHSLALDAQDVFLQKQSLSQLYEYSKKANKSKDALKYLEDYNKITNVNNSVLLKNRLEYYELKSEYERNQAEIIEEKRKAQMLQLELEHKERELTEKTRHLIKQTEAMVQFRDDLRALIRRTPADDPIVRSVKERLSNEPDKHLNWLEFEEEFRKVHPDYALKLNEKYPTLTKMEQKICAMLRVGLTSVDIAKLLFLSERNIENHRYRIRKKLCLNSEVSLHEFLGKV